MSLSVGTLHATLELRDQGFTTGLDTAGRKLTDLDSKATSSVHTVGQVGTAGAKAGQQAGGGFREASTQAGGLGTAIGKVKTLASGLGLVLGAQQAVKFFTGAIDSAREAEAIMFRTKSTFADAADGVDEWAKTTASGFRMSEDAAKSSALTFSTFGLAAGLAGQDLATFSTDLTELAGDLAAYGDYDIAEVVNDMSSALSGSAIPMRKYGVLLDDAALREIAFANGITESNRQLSAKEKAAATVIGMQQELAYSNDAAANSSETYGAALASLKAKFADVSTEIGQKLMPIAQAVVSLLAGPGLAALSGFSAALAPVGALIGAVASAFGALPGPIQTAIGLMIAAKLATMALNTSLVQGLGVKALSGAVMGMMSLRSPVEMARAGFASMRTGARNLLGALGGPWMVGLMAAGAAVAYFMNRNKEAKAHIEENKNAVSGLADTLASSGGEWTKAADEAAKTTLQTIKLKNGTGSLNEAFERMGVSTSVAASGLAGVGEDADRTRERLVKLKEEQQDQRSQWDKFKDEVSHLADNPLSTDRYNRDDIASTDGNQALQEWDRAQAELKARIAEDADQRVDIQTKLKVGLDVDLDTAGITAITDAMETFNDETASAVDRIKALSSALDAIDQDKFTMEGAAAKWGEATRDLDAAFKELGVGAIDAQGNLDTFTESGNKAHEALLSNKSAMNETAVAMKEMGAPASEIAAKMGEMKEAAYEQILALTGNADAARHLVDTYFDIENITPTINMESIQEATGILDGMRDSIVDMPDEKTIVLDAITDEAEQRLDGLDFKVKHMKDGTVQVTAKTDEAQGRLELIQELVRQENQKTVLTDVLGDDKAAGELQNLIDLTNADNEKDIHVDSNSTEVIELLKVLNVTTTTLADGTVVVTDNAEEVRRKIMGLSGLNTESRHTVYWMSQGKDAATASQMQGPVPYNFADGGVRSRASGALDTAQIRPGSGAGTFDVTQFGPVQWAEGETAWEAFIPGAMSKRRQSLKILQETAGRMGHMVIPNDYRIMADGGLTSVDDLNSFAQGIEGNQYVFGGSGSWATDCSGGVSAVVNKATGRDPFGSRTGTATMGDFLAERGFVQGAGGAGSLSVGWYNGGPYGGHTAGTLPNGINFEMGGARGDGQYGGSAAGASDSMFTNQMHLPAERMSGGDAGAGIEGTRAELATAQAALAAATTDDERAGAQASVDQLEAKLAGQVSAAGGSGSAVFVTNWPGGGTSSYSSSSGGGSTYSGADVGIESVRDLVDEDENVVDHNEVARATMQDGGEKAAEAALKSLLGDVGLDGSGFLPTLFKQMPEITKLFDEKHQQDMPMIQNHYNVTLADLEAFKREIERNTNRQIMQYGGGR